MGEGKDIREEKKMGEQKGGGKEVCTVIGRGKGGGTAWTEESRVRKMRSSFVF